MSTSTSEFDLNLNGIVTDINDLKSKTNPATSTTQGIARVATTGETTNGETVGSSPAFVTPEQIKEKINNTGYGVTLISTRTTSGEWVITDVDTTKPLFIRLKANPGDTGASIRPNPDSGVAEAFTQNLSDAWITFGRYTGSHRQGFSLSCSLTPISTTVTLQVGIIDNGSKLNAYQ